jgi:hypothetical protein
MAGDGHQPAVDRSLLGVELKIGQAREDRLPDRRNRSAEPSLPVGLIFRRTPSTGAERITLDVGVG